MNTQFPRSVRVIFDEFGPHVPYAVNLAELLQVPIEVFGPLPDATLLAGGALQHRAPHQLRAVMHQRIGAHVRALLTGKSNIDVRTHIEDMRLGDGYIVVSCATDTHQDVPVLSPAGERSVFRETKGPIFVPLGDGPSGLVGATQGIKVAAQLNTPIVFWHTTWRNARVTDDEPRLHITVSAEQVIANAEALASAAGIAYSTQCVCADDVVQGIIRAAQHVGASLVVMARGGHKLFGTYTDRVRARNCPIPMLMIPEETK